MLEALRRYARWLHLRWPAGSVEPLPEVRSDSSTRVPGLFIVGDLTGIPLLKFALDSGARAVRAIAADPALRKAEGPGPLDLVIVGAGVAGAAAALEARRLGLRFAVLESAEPFFTIANFPRGKPIFTYPRAMVPAGALQVHAETRETLLEELETQLRAAAIEVERVRVERVERDAGGLRVIVAGAPPRLARRVILAVGRSGDFRRLGVPGERLDHVTNRLHDPRDFAGRRALVVGGGDSAVETAVALVQAGAHVTLAHRGRDLARAKAENVERLERLVVDPSAPVEIESPSSEHVTSAATAALAPLAPRGSVTIRFDARVRAIAEGQVTVEHGSREEKVSCDAVFVMIGREPPLGLLRRSGVPIRGEWTAGTKAGLAAFLLFCTWLYDWKSGGFFTALWQRHQWFPFDLQGRLAAVGGAVAAEARDPATLLGTLAISAAAPAFWYTLAYSAAIVFFGWKRITRRRTPYVTAQTVTLALVQVLPLFLLPEVILPLLDHRGLLPAGLADALFPRVDYGHGREFWRAYGLVLAWPLNVYNVFTHQPLGWWLAISFVQTCVLIPLAIYFFGKGAYCGWICSCGALAETLGDTHRRKMPHGAGWNRFNLAGQVILAIAVLLLIVRVAGWMLPDGHPLDAIFDPVLKERYKWTVDVFLAGVVGYGVYFWLSGRFWCRFLCPLAALMHIYARFSRFRIFADKQRCISCGVCTSACHQGIDVMSFANRGLPMADPQCVRCSACVEECPTGVLAFGQLGKNGFVQLDTLAASPVRMREGI